jgi:galactonate dehydratase
MKIDTVESQLVGGSHFVRITTDTGLTGIGQSGCWAYPEAVHAIMPTFRNYLVGQDPMRIEHHWQHLYRMGPFRGSVLGGAVSAIDLSLWDIKGKHYQAPVWDLLGGHCRNKVRLFILLMDTSSLDKLIAAAKKAIDDGFTAVKFGPFPSDVADLPLQSLINSSVERVAAVRELVGPDIDIILEFGRRLTPLQSLPVMQALLQFNPLFIEDPIQIDSISSQAEIARRIQGPVGNGERLNTIWEFRELLAQGGSQFVRPDLGLAGGLTHCKKIASIAESYHSAVVTHNFLGPLLTAASIHLDVSIPNFVAQEYSYMDEGPTSAAFKTTMKRQGGYMPLPQTPGLGLELDPSVDVSHRPTTKPLHDIPLRADGSVAYAV